MAKSSEPSWVWCTRSSDRVIAAAFLGCWIVAGAAAGEAAAPAVSPAADYREPSAAVTRLLTAAQPPEPLVHARSGRVALLHREPVISLERLARPRIGLAGFRFDPRTGTSGVAPLVHQVEVVSAEAPSAPPAVWQPGEGVLLDHVEFAPDGRSLAALVVDAGPARLGIFDVASGRARVLDVPVNPSWGAPCRWVAADALICRLYPETRSPLPAERPAPILIEHTGGPAPVRTYPDLLDNSHEDALFEYYFRSDIGRVGSDGTVTRTPGIGGLIADFAPSPDGAFAVVTRVAPPYPRLVGVRRFPSSVEVWDIMAGKRLYASRPAGFGVDDAAVEADPRRAVWHPGAPTTLGFIDEERDAAGGRTYRFMAITAPFTSAPAEVARSPIDVERFGWTTAGTPWFSTPGKTASDVSFHVVLDGVPSMIWTGSAAERYESPGRALREDGMLGPVLEVDGRIFLAGDGLAAQGPQPFLDVFDLRTLKKQRLFTAAAGDFEPVLGVIDPSVPTLITRRETETEPPRLFLRGAGSAVPLGPASPPFAELVNTTRQVVRYKRADGVDLSGTLYLPATYEKGQRLPTLVWIYPYEFSDREQAGQLDVRSFRYHRVKGPSPLAALVEGYAVLLNPTVPILYEEGATTDDYLPQLVASVEAAVDHLDAMGVTDPDRVAVGGRSYGAFSAANLLIHSDRFATAIAMSGAYNRTLTPFGFQHERRSFWEAMPLYTKISPFFHVNRIKDPILLVHGGADENGGTPPIQARRFFHALVGEGGRVRYVELPGEGHHYWARENVLLAAAEMLDWLGKTIGPKAPPRPPAADRKGPGA